MYISGAAKGGLGHADAEVALCKAAAAYDILQMCPHMATKTHAPAHMLCFLCCEMSAALSSLPQKCHHQQICTQKCFLTQLHL